MERDESNPFPIGGKVRIRPRLWSEDFVPSDTFGLSLA